MAPVVGRWVLGRRMLTSHSSSTGTPSQLAAAERALLGLGGGDKPATRGNRSDGEGHRGPKRAGGGASKSNNFNFNHGNTNGDHRPRGGGHLRRGRGRRRETAPSDPHSGFMYRPPPPKPADGRYPQPGPTRHGSSAAVRVAAQVPDGHTAIDLTREDTEGLGAPSSQRVPLLQHGLRRVLFNRGVHTIKAHGDSSEGGGAYRFPPFLSHIHHPREVHFGGIPPFVTTSKDEALHSLAVQHGAVVKGSTSSMTSLLSQLYFQLSGFRPVNVEGLSRAYQDLNRQFTRSATSPVSVIMTPLDGVYSIDSDQSGGIDTGPPTNKILMDLGKSLERMLTTPEEEFKTKFLKSHGAQLLKPGDPAAEVPPEAYSYMRVGNTVMRSQLDCYDPELEGESKYFELKTRASAAIRLDCANYASKTGYRLTQYRGFNFSYEREFYDLVRSGFLKFAFQVRIGRMAGVFLAHHSTREMFGFEYITLAEMEKYVYGSASLGEPFFLATTKLLDVILTRIAADHASTGRDLRVVFSAGRTDRILRVYVEALPADHTLRWADKHVPGEGYDDDNGSGSGGSDDSPRGPAVDALSELEGRGGGSEEAKGAGLKALLRSYNRPRRGRTRKYTPAEVEQLIPVRGDLRMYEVSTKLSVNGLPAQGDFDYNPGDRLDMSYAINEVSGAGSGLIDEYRATLRLAYRLIEKELKPEETH